MITEKQSLLWMFIGSFIIGLFFNAMNLMAENISDLYYSLTLFYSAIVMASLMCLLVLIMRYFLLKEVSPKWTIFFIFLTFISIYFLRQQVAVNEYQYLKRMIPHHSTAIHNSKMLLKRNDVSEDIKKLAINIIESQITEIATMKEMLRTRK